MTDKVYLNGDVVERDKASVSVTNPSLLHGVGLFETMRSYEGVPFRLSAHVERMSNSARKLDMPIDATFEQIPAAIDAVLEANNLRDARIRVTAIPPSPQDAEGAPMLLVAAEELTGYAPELYVKGMTVFLCTDYRQSPQDPLAGHKTTSYFARLMVLRNAHNRGCGEALWFTPSSRLAEGCVSNVFLVKNNVVKTPPLDTPVLAGVTRATVLELAKEAAIEVQETACTVDDLLDANEVFLTNAIMEVMPVTHIERKTIGEATPGSITRQLLDAYRRRATAS